MNHVNNMLEISYTFRKHDYSDDTSLRNTYLSRHHIIPYYKMYGFGVIVLTYLYLKLKENDNYTVESDIRKLVKKYGNHYFNQYNIQNALTDRKEIDESSCQICLKDKSGGNLDNFLKYISWTNQNLFIGPSEKFRGEDPGQKCDDIPTSMGSNIFVEQLRKITLNGRGGQIPNINLNFGTIELSYGDLEGISKTFLKNLNCDKSIHETVISDWKAVVNKELCYDIYFVRRNAGFEGDKELVNFDFSMNNHCKKYKKIEQKAVAIYKLKAYKNSQSYSGLGWVKNIDFEAKNQQLDSILKYKQYFEINS